MKFHFRIYFAMDKDQNLTLYETKHYVNSLNVFQITYDKVTAHVYLDELNSSLN